MATDSFYSDQGLVGDAGRTVKINIWPSNNRMTYPRAMSVYENRPSTEALAAQPHLRDSCPVGPLSQEALGSGHEQWDPRAWVPLHDPVQVRSESKRRNPWSSLAGIYSKAPEEKEALVEEKDQPANHPVGWKLFLILLSGAIPYIVVVLDDTIVATIIPVLVSEFHEPGDIGWYATAYFLPMTVLMPVFGKCYSLWKIKWLFSFSLVILLAGSIVCGATSSSPMFIIGRATAGAGAAGIINGAMRIIGVSSPRKERSLLEAAGALVMGACTVAGPILGGVIADTIGWRWAFLMNIPIAVGALAIIFFIFPNEAPKTPLFRLSLAEKLKRLDPIGAVTLIGCLCCLVTLLESQSTRLGGLSSVDLGLAVATAILFAIFILHESYVRIDIALIPRTLVRHQVVWSCSILLFFLFAGFINFVFFLSVFFQTVVGETAKESAISLLPYVVAASVGAMLVGLSVPFVRYYNPFFFLGGILFVAGSGFIYSFDAQTTPLWRAASEAVLGAGAGFLILANVAPCHIQLDEKDHSVANGFLFLSSLLGATLSLPISSTIFNQKLLRGALDLQVPIQVKLDMLSDPTKIVSRVPAESLDAVVSVLVNSVRQTFLVGLIAAVACAMISGYVPVKPLIVDDKPPTPMPRHSKALESVKTTSTGCFTTPI